MAQTARDVIYVDVDDEITAVIEKLQTSSSKIVALVLPKRAAVFQSVVNMKLLKRSAGKSKKSLVLITSEQNIIPLAGVVGIHVASTLQSKPAIPAAPELSAAPMTVDEIEVGEPEEATVPSKRTPVIAPLPIADDEPIEIDDTPVAAAAAAKTPKKSYNKKLKVPDFNKFRTKLIIGSVLLLLLIGGFVFASIVLPKATVVIKTDTTEVASAITVTSSPAVDTLNEDSNLVPGALKEYKKTEVQKVPATGQVDKGTKASGSVTLSLDDCSKEQVTVVAGTTVTAGNFNYITQADVTMQSVKIGPTCRNDDFKNVSTSKVNVVAEKAGDAYNLSSRDYSVAGYSNVSGKGSTMKGGTSNIVKVISQQDIDGAKQKAIDTVSATANEEVTKLLVAENFFPITDTFVAKDPIVTSSPGVEDEAEEVTVSVTLTYTMAGADRDALKTLLTNDIESNIDKSQQKILDTGLDSAGVVLQNKKDSGETTFELQARATAGVEQNEDDIKTAVAGKKKSEAEQAIRSRQGILEVTVEYSPFWVSKVPGNEDKISVVFESSDNSSSNE